jgi:transcriptional regulator with XRE-family HTH domain
MRKSVFTDAYRYFISLLIAARKTKNLTQAVLAQRLGKPQSFVSKYESCERRLDVVETILVTNAIGVNLAVILKKTASIIDEE